MAINLDKINDALNKLDPTKSTNGGGDDIIKLPDGGLTTMYHYLKNSEKGIEEVLSTTKFEDVDAWLN